MGLHKIAAFEDKDLGPSRALLRNAPPAVKADGAWPL
jgi:hypothetical protein